MRSAAISVTLLLAALPPTGTAASGVVARPRCSADARTAAVFVIPPAPFKARVVSVKQLALPEGEPAGRGRALERLYEVTFDALVGNAVLPSRHRYSQFAYVSRRRTGAPWCFLKGGSGP